MSPLQIVSAALLGYLVGSFSFARLVAGRAAPKQEFDKTRINIPGTDEAVTVSFVSATTVSVRLGPRLGFLTVVLDMLKAATVTLAAKLIWPDQSLFVFTAIGAMIGHNWPIYHRLRGGRGLSAVYGSLFVIDPIGFFVTSIGGLLFSLFVLRDFVLAYFAGLWILIPWLWFRTQDVYLLVYAVAANIIYGLAYIPEMSELVRLTKQYRSQGFTRTQILMAELQLTGMGRGIYKMARRLNLLPELPSGGSPAGEGA